MSPPVIPNTAKSSNTEPRFRYAPAAPVAQVTDSASGVRAMACFTLSKRSHHEQSRIFRHIRCRAWVERLCRTPGPTRGSGRHRADRADERRYGRRIVTAFSEDDQRRHRYPGSSGSDQNHHVVRWHVFLLSLIGRMRRPTVMPFNRHRGPLPGDRRSAAGTSRWWFPVHFIMDRRARSSPIPAARRRSRRAAKRLRT